MWNKIIPNPQQVADMINTFFCRNNWWSFNQNSSKNNAHLPKQSVNCCPKTIFIYPITEYEMEHVIESLKAKLSISYNEIWEYLVKLCIEHTKKLL
jgi:hypothetical protein